jgi:signal transduction histidine kinase
MKDRAHDVYLVDQNLGLRDGVELVQAATRAGVTAPMILLTGSRDREVDIRATEAGAADFLVKGHVDAEQLERSLRYAVQRDRDRQALRRHAEELARSNAELEQFAAAVSHDLRAPLQVILGRLELLAASTPALPSHQRRHIDIATQTVLRMEELIDDLLAYARVGTGPSAEEDVALSDVLDDVVAEMAAVIEERGARIARDTLPVVRGSRVQLTQLFRNLVGNAIKFAGDRPPEIEVQGAHGDAAWHVTVRDHGLGFEPRHAEAIFGLFHRLKQDPAIPGTGIGLAICRKVVENHGGRIWAEGEPGDGAAFHFTLPDRRPGRQETSS